MIKHADSHLDHALTEAQVAYIVERYSGRDAFFVDTFELPTDLGTVPCMLWGPTMGDPPVTEQGLPPWIVAERAGPGAPLTSGKLVYETRGPRTWPSRLIDAPKRQTRMVTVIAGPHDGKPCVLYTAFGGPPAAQEPGDPGCKDPAASAAFWAEHALAK